MAAPDFETIYNVEDAVEAAAKAVLEGMGVKAFMQRESGQLPNERVDVQCQLGQQLEHRVAIAQAPLKLARNAWEYTLVFNLMTNRTVPDGSGQPVPAAADTHGRFRARVRMAMEYWKDLFTAGVLPYHELTSMTQRGTDPQVNVEDEVDVSTLMFGGIVAVRKDAWLAPV